MIQLEHLRNCFEGTVPAAIATCDEDGLPNVSYVSHVHYVDNRHLALTFQFFNKTHHNVHVNPQTTLLINDPNTVARYRLALRYKYTQESGPLFQSMKARLASIASATQMEDVFRLRGADIYQVLDIEEVPGPTLPAPVHTPSRLLQLRQALDTLTRCPSVDSLCDTLLQLLPDTMGINHALLLIVDGDKLYTVNSCGYSPSGIGSEIPVGYGIIGTAARYNTPIRMTHNSSEYSYLCALGNYLQQHQDESQLETQIAYPGLVTPQSQLAIPISDGDQVLGVLFAESEHAEGFDHHCEDALICLAQSAAQTLMKLQLAPQTDKIRQPIDPEASPSSASEPLIIQYFPQTHSIFIDHHYLIKGVAGAILWRLLGISQQQQRYKFTNKELRLDKSLGLPEVGDNLETRLTLLRRRLAERCDHLRVQPAGRGCFELIILKPLVLQCEAEVAGAPAGR